MKKRIVLTCAAFFAAATVALTGCPQSSGGGTPAQSSGGTYEDGAKDDDGNVTSDLKSAELKTDDADNLKYVFDGDFKYEAKDAASGWKNVTADVLSVAAAGTDKVLKIAYDLTGTGEKKLDVSLILGGKNIANSVWKTKLYIPESYTAAGEAVYPVVQLFAKYGTAWASTTEVKLNTTTIGSGWHTITVDIGNAAVKIDDRALSAADLSTGETADVSTWKANLSAAQSVGVRFYANGISAAMEGPFYIDYVHVTDIAAAIPAAPSIAYDAGTGTVTITGEAGSGCTFRYTMDGSEPTVDSTEYTAPFAAAAGTTVKAIAVNDAGAVSAAATKICSAKKYTFDAGTAEGFTGGEDGTIEAAAFESQKTLKLTVNAGGAKVTASAAPDSADMTGKKLEARIWIPAAHAKSQNSTINSEAKTPGVKLYAKSGDWAWGDKWISELQWLSDDGDEWVTVSATFAELTGADGCDITAVKEFGISYEVNGSAACEPLYVDWIDIIDAN